MYWRFSFLWIVALSRSTYCTALSEAHRTAQPVVIDTDIMSDVDDVGALAVANVLHNCGLANLRSVVINTHSRYGALAASVINTYFGNGEVPIASLRPLTDEVFLDTHAHLRGEYASKLAYNWPRALNDSDATLKSLELYRSILSSADNGSINVISIGFLTNLADLLRSGPDEYSSLTGAELVVAKVKELIVMGGAYPSGWEYNFGGVDPESAAYVLKHWPTSVPITFSGLELGGNIHTGQTLRSHAPEDSPVRAAYEWYVGRCSTVQKSWDPLTVLYGVLGMDGFSDLGMRARFVYGNVDGYNTMNDETGSNAWVNDAKVETQHWLKLADGVSNESVASMLNELYTQDPRQRECFGFAKGLTSQVDGTEW